MDSPTHAAPKRDDAMPALGVGTPLGFGIPASALVGYAQEVEAAGLDDISVGELRSTEVFSLASAFVAATTDVRVETSIVAAVTRAPTLVAMAAATLSQLSRGRFVLGLGAGSPMVAGWHGRQLSAPVAMMDRTVRVVRAALAGERSAELGDFRLAPEMVGPVPVVLSAMNRRMLELAGRVADGVVLQFCGPVQAEAMALVARQARRAEAGGSPFEVIVNVWAAVGDDRSEAECAFRREVAPYLAVPTYRTAAVALSSDAEVDAAARAWRHGGRDAAAAAVPQRLVDELLVVLGADDVRARLAAYRIAGVDRVRFVPLTLEPGSDANARGMVARLAELRAAAVPVGGGGS
jgi:alkanesulfonate monooxygenase SsuD/methylene tetrahydromethanopterin reductase-like flavin-dependent oxidoreductase (luciferase family)